MVKTRQAKKNAEDKVTKPASPVTRRTRSAPSPKGKAAEEKKTKPAPSPKTKKPAQEKKTKAAASPKAKAAEKPAPAQQAGYVQKNHVEQALTELEKFLNREDKANDSGKSKLFEADETNENQNLYVEVQRKKFFSRKADVKAKLISMPKPFKNVGDEDFKTCLFVRDSLITDEKKLAEVEQAGIPTLKKIYSLTQLKTIYHTFEKRRELYKEFDMFVVDDAILSSMPATLGLTFFDNDLTKFPVCIRVTSTKSEKELSLKTLENQINKVLASTYYMKPVDTTVKLPIGALNKFFSHEDLLANFYAVLDKFPENEVKTIGIKSKTSPVIPLFYTSKIYDDEDIEEGVAVEEEAEPEEDVYTNALLELGDLAVVEKVIGKELRKKNKNKKKSSASKGISKA